MKPLPIPSRIWSKFSIDFVTDLPQNEKYKDFLMITDRLNFFLEFCDSMDAEACPKYLFVNFTVNTVYQQLYFPMETKKL